MLFSKLQIYSCASCLVVQTHLSESSTGNAPLTFVTTNWLLTADLPGTPASSQQLMSRQVPARGNIVNDLFAVVNRLFEFVGALSDWNTCFDWVLEQVGGPKEKSLSGKRLLEGSHSQRRKRPRIASAINTTTDMNQPHSCPGNCSALRIIYTPLPLPESCGDGRDSEYTPGLYSGGC